MSHLTLTDLSALESTATTAAAYLDACDSGAKFVRLDPTYYQACGNLLLRIFSVVSAYEAFPGLVAQSNAARDVAEGVEMGHKIEVSRLAYYPKLAAILSRAAV
jgi:hypothetical protein